MAYKNKLHRLRIKGEKTLRGEKVDDLEGKIKITQTQLVENKVVEKADQT